MHPADREIHNQLKAKQAETFAGCSEKLLSDLRLTVINPIVNEAIISPVNTGAQMLGVRDNEGQLLKVKAWKEISSSAAQPYLWLRTGARWLGALVPCALAIAIYKGAFSSRAVGELAAGTASRLEEKQTAAYLTRNSLATALEQNSKEGISSGQILLSRNPYGQFWTDIGDAGEDFLNQQRQRLLTLLKKREPRIVDAVDSVEQRSDLSPKSLGKIYKDLCGLVDGPEMAPLERKPRALALDILDLVADPSGVRQGYHPTCGVAALEYLNYTKLPSNAVELVATVAKTGRYKCADGSQIILTSRSLQPELSASRSHASQIFQNTGVNIFWQRQTQFTQELDKLPPLARSGEKGFLRYERVADDLKNSPYRLLDYSSGEARPVVEAGHGIQNFLPADPYMDLNKVNDICRQINGRGVNGIAMAIGHGNAADLHMMLRARKAAGKLPAITCIHTGQPPFNDGLNGNGDWHAIVVTDYNQGSGVVSIFNPWGKNSSPDRLYLEQLWQAARDPRQTVRG